MEKNDCESNDTEHQDISLSVLESSGVPTVSANLMPASGIETEDSPTLKYLRLRNGDYSLPNRVFLIVNGQRHEITMDALPVDDAPAGT